MIQRDERWHSYLTEGWNRAEWNGWEGRFLRTAYLTLCMVLGLLLIAFVGSILFLAGYLIMALGIAGAIILWAWVVVAHYPEDEFG